MSLDNVKTQIGGLDKGAVVLDFPCLLLGLVGCENQRQPIFQQTLHQALALGTVQIMHVPTVLAAGCGRGGIGGGSFGLCRMLSSFVVVVVEPYCRSIFAERCLFSSPTLIIIIMVIALTVVQL